MALPDAKQKPEVPVVESVAEPDGLVAVHKHGETLRVHPSCVDAHVKTGWKVV
jgi:hypothetical protein